LGTDRGLYLSRDGGSVWKELKLNLPTVAVSDLVVKNDDLVVGTSGRSIWIFDDLTPLRDYSAKPTAKDAPFFSPQPAGRYRAGATTEEPPRLGSFANPPTGVVLHYFLKEKPKKELTLEILDGRGMTVQTLSSKEEPKDKEAQDEGGYSDDKPKPTVLPKEPGLNRVVWNLKYAGAKLIKGAKQDGGHPEVGPMVNPGTYTFRLNVDAKIPSASAEE